MNNFKYFDGFAPAIIKVYRRDKEAFWKAVFTPFLANKVTLVGWLSNIGVDIGLQNAFRGLDNDARQLMQEFSAPFGFDITMWQSYRLQYFNDAYAVFAFLAVWKDEMHLDNLIDHSREILRQLDDQYLGRLVDITELRLKKFLRTDFGLDID